MIDIWCDVCQRYVSKEHLSGHMVEVESKDIDKWDLGY